MTKQTGMVYLVGSGPGDAAYLTVRAQQLLFEAEVLVYDALVDSALLQLVPETCLLLNVGKRGGKPSMLQADINALLVYHCLQQQQVVRLKSGDPFIFGRCHAEIEALTASNCLFEVVPGLSSALTAPLLAGIPLTDPVLSRCFTVLSSHDPEGLDWQTLSQIDTLVILMGGQHLPEIVRQLQAHGRSPQTPIAIIRWASRPQQHVWEGALSTILQQTATEALSPCVIVIGEVVRLRSYLQPRSSLFSSTVLTTSDSASDTTLPFAGKTVLVTRSANQSGQFTARLQRDGATVVEMPALEIVPPSSWQALDDALTHLADFDWLMLTSANSVDYFFERLATQIRDVRALAALKIAVVGDKTAQKLEQRGLKPDFVPPEFIADSLADHFPVSVRGARILFPRVESGGRDLLVKDFISRGADVTEVAAYQSLCPETIAPDALTALQTRTVDVITFASAKTVKHFCQLLEQSQIDNAWQEWLEGVCIASIGPQTTKACTSLLGRVDAEAQEYTLDGLVQAIAQWFAIKGA
ncbi:uroporphyrinogen-III C-methyltransferase [Stenomitos frigidus]|uniref:uroporphyrinogen-III C-methyltransferase n=1 Tax=Stenomitos frigidus ULC18 TaxID=2107698 RepID=A0A2T1EIZ3_9CYAN|nr:uroporphyrinogen-III C-methyltransferase [Stenomitos frigidus]PSB32655.1 uroporphyrinogen-III C-methyltransferase [Stenomitos frigidus ULC18]